MNNKIIALFLLLCVFYYPKTSWAFQSSKKGIAGPGCYEGNCADEHLTQLGQLLDQADVSWFYTWWPSSTDVYWNTGKEYIPNAPGNTNKIREMIETRNYWGGYWLIGNEPNLKQVCDEHEENCRPYTYDEAARDFGRVAHALLEVDPTAKIIMLGLSSPVSSKHGKRVGMKMLRRLLLAGMSTPTPPQASTRLRNAKTKFLTGSVPIRGKSSGLPSTELIPTPKLVYKQCRSWVISSS